MLNRCSNIITTNYDTLIEDNTSFKRVVGSRAFVMDQCIGYGEIYKIHGCCTQPNSIVITGDDYKKFNEKKTFYHSKLLISFVEKPIIFLGYSISDKYILQILEDVSDNLDNFEINNLANRLIFIEYDKDVIEPEMYIKHIANINMTCIRTNNFSQIYNIISENIQVGIPLELIRTFQEAVKSFVYEQDNPKALAVTGIDELTNIDGLTAFHIGTKPISDKKQIIKQNDLILDVLFNNLDMNSEDILSIVRRETSLFPRTSYTPLYRYAKKCSDFDISYLTNHRFKSKEDMYSQCDSEGAQIRILNTEEEALVAIDNTQKNYEKLSYLFSNLRHISTKNLRITLTKIYESDNKILGNTKFRKLICMLDYLESL